MACNSSVSFHIFVFAFIAFRLISFLFLRFDQLGWNFDGFIKVSLLSDHMHFGRPSFLYASLCRAVPRRAVTPCFKFQSSFKTIIVLILKNRGHVLFSLIWSLNFCKYRTLSVSRPLSCWRREKFCLCCMFCKVSSQILKKKFHTFFFFNHLFNDSLTD